MFFVVFFVFKNYFSDGLTTAMLFQHLFLLKKENNLDPQCVSGHYCNLKINQPYKGAQK